MSSISFHPDALRKRFHELGKEREKIVAAAQPLREQRDVMHRQIDEIRTAMRPLNEQIKAVEAPLYDVDVERGAIAKALGGKTGTPD
jgi:uncharacterized coiled-coil DUF342 family protein